MPSTEIIRKIVNIFSKSVSRSDATDVSGVVERAEQGEMDWKTCLETIFKMEQCTLEQETYGW